MNDEHKLRFETLEIKLAFQEDVIQKLDEALSSQQQQLMELRHQVKVLGTELRARDSANQSDATPEPPPPHY